MPNGDDLSPDEFERFHQPLCQVDGLLDRFATLHGATLVRNYHNSPNRQLRFIPQAGISKMISLSLVYARPDGSCLPHHVYYLDVSAHTNTPDIRVIWFQKLTELSSTQLRVEVLSPLLEQAARQLADIDEEYLRIHGQVTKRARP